MPGIHETTASKRLWVPQSSAPATPAADVVAMWVDDDFVLHWKDENGATRSPADMPVEANATATSYTLVAADAGKHVRFTDAAVVAITVPTNASVAYPVGTAVELHAAGAGGLTVAGDGGVTVDGTTTVAEGETARLRKVATDTWTVHADAGSGASVEVIAESVLGSAAASIDFASIPATYDHLRLVMSGRGDVAATTVDVYVKVNADGGNNYDSQRLFGIGSSASASELVGVSTGMRLAALAGGTAPAGAADGSTILLPDYARTTFQKMATARTTRKSANAAGGVGVFVYSGFWRSTAAINQLTLTPLSGNFDTGTVVTLYGIKGAA